MPAPPSTSEQAVTARRLTVLGCQGSWPEPGRAGSGYLVEAGGVRVLLDAGPGIAERWASLAGGVPDAVVATHSHVDHVADLDELAAVADGLGERLRVIGPAEVVAPLGAGPGASAEVAEPGRPVTIGPLALGFERTEHGPVTLAVRVAHGGHALGYTADTGPGWDGGLLAGVDLLVAEATFADAADHPDEPGHLDGRAAGELATRLGVGRLLVTHIRPEEDAGLVVGRVAGRWAGPLTVASEGLVETW